MPHPRPLTRPRGLSLALALALALAGCVSPSVPTGLTQKPAVNMTRGGGKVGGGPRTSASDAMRNAAAESQGQSGRLLLAMYVIGSDLEDDVNPKNEVPDEQDNGGLSRDGNATQDFMEIVKAYQGLSEAERANIDVLVAFGGARQTGWKGVKYLDLKGLLKDAEDGYFGNASPETYLFDEAGVNMGDQATFQRFLERVEARRTDSPKVFVDIWDHGGSYGGMGPDTNTDAKLTNEATRAALEATGFKADMIGYDACLMASAEVISAVRGHFDFLVASEEEEPGHGWDYTLWVSQAAKAPEAGASQIGRMVVDSFLDSPAHADTNGRTLSVINLARAGGLLTAMDAFAGTYHGGLDAHYQGLLNSTAAGPKYGSEGKAGDECALDLYSFAEAVKQQAPAGGAADGVMRAVKDCVVYSREDGTRPGSHGVSFFSLANLNSFETKSYHRENASSPTWFGFVEAFMARGGNDAVPPTVTQVASAAGTRRATVSDNLGVSEVYASHAVRRGDALALIAREPAGLDEDGPLEVSPSAWDGQALHLADGRGGYAPVPTTFEQALTGGFSLHSADVVWNGLDAVLYLVLDAQHHVVDAWGVPYKLGANGVVQFSREQFQLMGGDVLELVMPVLEQGAMRYQAAAPITLTGEPSFSWRRVDGAATQLVYAEDLKGNLGVGATYDVP